MDLDFPSSCPAAQPLLPDSHPPKQNRAGSGMKNSKVNPTQVCDHEPHPVVLMMLPVRPVHITRPKHTWTGHKYRPVRVNLRCLLLGEHRCGERVRIQRRKRRVERHDQGGARRGERVCACSPSIDHGMINDSSLRVVTFCACYIANNTKQRQI